MAEPITLTMDGLILNWLKSVGDEVKAGEVIVEVEADKATVEVEAPADGVLTQIDAEIGEELEEGSVIGQIGAADEVEADSDDAPAEKAPAEATAGFQASEKAPDTVATPAANGSANGAASMTPEGRIKASPVARNIADERGIDLKQIAGTGPNGRIVKSDAPDGATVIH